MSRDPAMMEGAPASMSSKVAEVFMTAGVAFQKLGDLTLQLNSSTESQENMRWTEEDVEQVNVALEKFSHELDSVCRSVQARTVKQIKTDLKRKQALGSYGVEEGREGSPAPKKANAGAAKKVVRKSYGAAATPRPISSTHQYTHQGNVNLLSDGYGNVGPDY